MKAAGGSETNIRMAERSVRSTLATLFLPLVGSRSNIEFFFEEPSTGREAVAYDDERLQQSIKEGPAEEDKTK